MYDVARETLVTKSTKPGKPTVRPPLTLMQILVLVGLVAGLLVMLDFNRRQGEVQRLTADRNRVGTEVAKLDLERLALQTQVAYATTDAAVIAWAHEHGKLVQENEVLVVPVMPTPAPTPAPTPLPPRPAAPSWTLWRDLFFDVGPGS
jgi:hypothetical protein